MTDILEKVNLATASNNFCNDRLKDLPIAMAYVPMQAFRDLYEDETRALKCGTLFKELYKPFEGKFTR